MTDTSNTVDAGGRFIATIGYSGNGITDQWTVCVTDSLTGNESETYVTDQADKTEAAQRLATAMIPVTIDEETEPVDGDTLWHFDITPTADAGTTDEATA